MAFSAARGRYLGMDLSSSQPVEAKKLFPSWRRKTSIGAIYIRSRGGGGVFFFLTVSVRFVTTQHIAKSAATGGGAEIVRSKGAL